MAAPLALPVLLSRVLGRVSAELAAEPTEPTEPIASLPVWSNVLRCVDGGTEPALARAARISRRLAVAAVSGAARRGWVVANKRDRWRQVVLTEAGARSCEVWGRRLIDLERQWTGAPLHQALAALVGQLPYALAHYPASYGTADPSAIGGSFVRSHGGALPAHGADWQWVLRSPGDPVDASPVALLSQALTAFAIDYEATPMWPLASTTLVVQHLSVHPQPISALPPGHGITGKGTSLLERHGLAVVTSAPDAPRERVVQLTPYGKKVQDHHRPYLDATEASWRERYGGEVVAELRAALQEHPAAADPTLPDHVVAPLHGG